MNFTISTKACAASIIPGVSDKRIQTFPNRMTLEVRIDPACQITGVSLIQRDRLDSLRKFECSAGGLRESTPGFNVNPLYRVNQGVDNESFKKIIKKFSKNLGPLPIKDHEILIKELNSLYESNWDFTEKSKISLCLEKAARDLEKLLAGTSDPRLASLMSLLKRSMSLDAKTLHERIDLTLRNALLSVPGGFRVKDCLKMLISNRESEEKNSSTNESFSLVLELADWSTLGSNPANHEVVWTAVNEHLIAKQADHAAAETRNPLSKNADKHVGIFGEKIHRPIETMPEKTLSRLGKVKLFSLANIPCQRRYGLIESGACPVGPEIQAQLAAALQWITDPNRRDKTWADVSNACGFNKQAALLIAYLDKMPANPPSLTSLIVPDSSDEEDDHLRAESGFEVRTEPLVQALRGLQVENPHLSISLFVIAKADKARKKLLFSGRFTVERMIAAAEEWTKAAQNLPPVYLRAFDANRKPYWRKPSTPYPSDVVRVINTWWDGNGQNPKRVSDALIGIGLRLLLETGPALAKSARCSPMPRPKRDASRLGLGTVARRKQGVSSLQSFSRHSLRDA